MARETGVERRGALATMDNAEDGSVEGARVRDCRAASCFEDGAAAAFFTPLAVVFAAVFDARLPAFVPVLVFAACSFFAAFDVVAAALPGGLLTPRLAISLPR